MPVNRIDNTHLYAAKRLTISGYWSGTGGSTGGTATCFIIGDGREPAKPGFLVTNRHVLAPPPDEQRGLCHVESLTVDGFTRIHAYTMREEIQKFSFTVRNPSAILPSDVDLPGDLDVACIDLSTADLDGDVPRLDLWGSMLGIESDYSRLTAGSEIVISGYASVLTRDGITKAGERPILVSGIIASDPRFPAVFGENTYESGVLTHSFSWGGMSGSPVFALARNPFHDIGNVHTRRVPPMPAAEHDIILAGVNAGHIHLQQSSAAGSITYFMKAPVIAKMIGYDVPGHAMVAPRSTDTPSSD